MREFSITHLLLLGLVLFCSIIFPLMALIDAAKGTSKNKVLWIAIIFFFNFFGALIYWLVGRTGNSKAVQ